jgi:hypothetical protein
MKKTLLALRQWVVDEAGMVGAVLLICVGFMGGVIYEKSSASLTIAQINATHAEQLQWLTQQQANEIKRLSGQFGQTIERKDGTSRELVHAVTEKLKADTKEQGHGK